MNAVKFSSLVHYIDQKNKPIVADPKFPCLENPSPDLRPESPKFANLSSAEIPTEQLVEGDSKTVKNFICFIYISTIFQIQKKNFKPPKVKFHVPNYSNRKEFDGSTRLPEPSDCNPLFAPRFDATVAAV